MPTFTVGGGGAFGILINLLPKEFVELYELTVEKGDLEAAREFNKKLSGIYGLMEAQGSPYPGPVKAGLDLIGRKGGIVRKSLIRPTEEIVERIREELVNIGYDVKDRASTVASS